MNNKAKLIAIVGMPGAGKSVAAQFFKDKGIPVLRFGDQTDIGLNELGMPLSEKNERWYREEIRRELGMAAMAIKIVPRINAVDPQNKLIALDGLYSWEEYLYLNGAFPEIQLLCIYARPELRYQWLAKRKIRPLTREEARSRDIAELENLNKGGPIALADYLIKNESTEADFYKELEKFCETI